MARRIDPEKQPPIPCWFCWRPLQVARILRDGIILGREERRGGPERLLICPSCMKENLCEETPRGRWFASPSISVGLLDILFSRLPGGSSEEVLQAISWYRENEERRRAFFLGDGDHRYGGTSFLEKLWPWAKPEPAPRGKRTRKGPAGTGTGTETGGGDGAGKPPPGARPGPRSGTGERAGGAGKAPGAGGEAPRDRPGPGRSREPGGPARPRVVTPHEILGLSPGATSDEVRRAFHRLAVRYHPDKVHHLGEEYRAIAHVKFQELKRAYDALTGGGA